MQLNKVHERKEEDKNKRSHNITAPLDWMAASSAYTAVAVHLKPQRAFELAAYTSIIINLARDGRGQAWSKYSQQMRQLSIPSSNGTSGERDIWLMALMGAAAPPATRPPSQQGLPPVQRSTWICHNWNKGLCTHPPHHLRSACLDTGHMTRDSPTITTQATIRQAPK